MSEELTVLKEYFTYLKLDKKILTCEDLDLLQEELEENGEFGLAKWVSFLETPNELLDYLGEEDE